MGTSLATGYTGYFQGHTVTMLERLILWELGQVSGTTISFSRFPKWMIREKLIERQNFFVAKSKCIRKFALLVADEGTKQYRLPLNCMDNGVISAQYYDSATSYEDLELRDTLYLDANYPGWRLEGNSTPSIAYMGDYYGNIPMIGVYPPPDSDGTNYASAPETGLYIGSTLPAASNNYTGVATSGSATTLGDTEVDFTTYGLVAGMYVRNVTDGSYGYITIIAANQLTISTLTGGTANVFAAGDTYNILAGEYGVITSWANDDQYIFGSEVGLVNNITVPAGNIRVDYVPYPLPFSYDPTVADASQGADEQYPDIPKLYHQALAHGVIADLLGTFHENSREFQRAGFYEQKFLDQVVDASRSKFTRPFQQVPTGFRATKRRR